MQAELAAKTAELGVTIGQQEAAASSLIGGRALLGTGAGTIRRLAIAAHQWSSRDECRPTLRHRPTREARPQTPTSKEWNLCLYVARP